MSTVNSVEQALNTPASEPISADNNRRPRCRVGWRQQVLHHHRQTLPAEAVA